MRDPAEAGQIKIQNGGRDEDTNFEDRLLPVLL